jgi:chemosensory pili system protein ChpA (sensor histidine kinase/response regulator)
VAPERDEPSGDTDFAPEEMALLRDFFRDEAHDALERVTARLLSHHGEAAPGPEMLTELMRTTHTIKGSAGTVGLHEVAELAHRIEDHFAELRAGRRRWSENSIDLLVETIDALRGYLDCGDDTAAAAEAVARVRSGLSALGGGSAGLRVESGAVRSDITGRWPSAAGAEAPWDVVAADSGVPVGADDDEGEVAVGVALGLEEAGGDGGVETFRADGSDDSGDDHGGSERRGRARRDTDLSDGTPAAELHGGDSTRSILARLAGSGVGDGDRSGPRTVLRVEPDRIDALMDSVGELAFDRTRIERRVQHLRNLARDLGRTRQRLRDEIGAIRGAAAESAREEIEGRLRGLELELAQQVTQLAQSTAALLDDADALRQTAADVQEGLTRVRMSTARSLFQHLGRALRGIARAGGKRVELHTIGADTEFDKAVATQITDPLVQLLRNAVAHGVETPGERVLRGKSPTGNVHLAVRQEGHMVVLELSDDGRGVDPRALRRRFVESGRWTESRAQGATDEDVLHAIFDPGMSSRDEADELAGRGVGLDAVRETIARLGGEIRLTSTPGKGTAFTMRLPVSTAVSHAELFKVGGQVYAVPYVHVAETTTAELTDGLPATLMIRQDRVPLVSLHAVLGAPLPAGHGVPVIVLAYAGKRLAITCDKIVGPREIVVKHLGPLLAPLPLYAGATISGSGKVQLILDPAALVHLAYPDARDALAGAEVPAVSAGEAPRLVGRVLVADDSRAIREALTRILAREGYIVDVAEDGARAWEMAQQLRYDLLITDLEMPRAGGFELIARLRGDSRLAPVPVIVVSSRATPENRRRARELAVKSFVAKPVTRRKMVDALREV